MSRGIVYIAFGPEYERLAGETISRSLPFIGNLPVCLLINNRRPLAGTLELEEKGVSVVFIDAPTDRNRDVKTRLFNYSPFDETLYIDTDSVVRKPGIEKIFDFLHGNDAVFQLHKTWRKNEKYYDLYRRALSMFGCIQPLRIFIGGFFAFKKTEKTGLFFSRWNEYWKRFGSGRDMPPLACAMQKSGLECACITRQNDRIFSFGVNEDCIVVHRVKRNDLETKFGISAHRQNKPFDRRADWALVYSESEQKKPESNGIMTTEKVNGDIFRIRGGRLECDINLKKGGTISRVSLAGNDCSLYRQGCEYWINDREHFEQEFGEIIEFQTIAVQPEMVRTMVKATLFSPQFKKNGGHCIVYTDFFSSGKIICRSVLIPLERCDHFDQYLCFRPSHFEEYRYLDSEKWLPIESPAENEAWWYNARQGAGGIAVRSKKLEINTAASGSLPVNTIHKSKSMMEIKHQANGNPDREFTMELKYAGS